MSAGGNAPLLTNLPINLQCPNWLGGALIRCIDWLGDVSVIQESLLARVNRDVTFGPADITINFVLTDIGPVWKIPETRLVCYALLSSASQRFAREDTNQLHVFMSIVKLMNVLEEKDCAH